MAKTTIRKQLNISVETYQKLALLKGSSSFDEYIELMLNFFKVTEVDPRSIQTLPHLEIKKDIERMIKISKAQEKKYLSSLDSLDTKINTLINIFSSGAEALKGEIDQENIDNIEDNINPKIKYIVDNSTFEKGMYITSLNNLAIVKDIFTNPIIKSLLPSQKEYYFIQENHILIEKKILELLKDVH